MVEGTWNYDGIEQSQNWKDKITRSFPDEQDGKLTMTLPSSLTQLTIDCPKLASLPEKCLPPSLLQLYSKDCPLLKQHCKKGRREWSKIANVPWSNASFLPVL
ncbi:hypothetical protein CMV_027535 [Castanea mollissima]|uniref:Uncharacterized protein n=1 Tax=Castanea mollissima TaxID=60419 RepID=A0A8J4V999_9ROSI|nr:hypothetical protein CMV_027535 [Castanea mollissima]